MNGDGHKRRRVVRVDHLHSLREEWLQFHQLGFDSVRGIQRVCPGCQLDPKAGCRLTVNTRHDVVVFPTQLDTRDVFQVNNRTIAVHA